MSLVAQAPQIEGNPLDLRLVAKQDALDRETDGGFGARGADPLRGFAPREKVEDDYKWRRKPLESLKTESKIARRKERKWRNRESREAKERLNH